MPLDIYWPDSHLNSLRIDYDLVRIDVTEFGGRERVLLAAGPIGVEQVGLWDEVIIEMATVSDDHAFAARCWSDIQRRHQDAFDSGSPSRNGRRFQTLEITFQDGSALRVAAAQFAFEGD